MSDNILYVEDFRHVLGSRSSGNIKTFCPFCHENRGNKRDKSLSINCATLAYNCHYCGASGYLKSRHEEMMRRIDRETRQMSKTYRKPSVKPNLQPKLNADMVEYFKGRGISEKTLLEAKVTKENFFFPQDNCKRGCIAFNYYVDDEHINTKYRTRDKHFAFIAGAKVVPYNIDSIRESAFKKGEKKICIITEGEADTLTYIECGYKHVISMPSGANTNLEWMDDFTESHFDKLELIYVSTDSDKKGVEAKNEIVRRFGAEVCKIVEYPEDCKDINEVLVKYGREKVKECFENAADIRIQGVEELVDIESDLDNLFTSGLQKGVTLGLEDMDKLLSFNTGMVTVVTGIPSHGKTQWLNFALIRLNILHSWKVAFFSPEFYPVALHISQIIETLGGKRFSSQNYTPQTYGILKEYVNKNFFWVDPDDTDISSVLDRAKFLIRKRGIKAFVIDPFNSLTDEKRTIYKQDEYISDFLQKIRWFARKYDVAMFIVMHPTKQYKQDNGLYPVCDLYSCKGASEIYDKADIGITVWRNEQGNYGEVHVTKMKFRHMGQKGHDTFVYNFNNARFVEIPTMDAKRVTPDMDKVRWDNSNYVIENIKAQQNQQELDFGAEQPETPHNEKPFDAPTDEDIPF